MRFTELEVIPYALAFERPYATARGTLERREMLLVLLHTDAEHVGLGEAVPLSLRGGADLGTVERALLRSARRLRRADLSDFAGEQPLRAAIDAFIHVAAGRRLPGPAKAALEMAIFDLAGKAAGRPLWSLLGAPERAPVRCNATLVAGTPAEVAADAERWAGHGFTSFKLKLGAGEDVAQVRAVREALGPQARIRLDANGAWSVAEALGVLRMVEPLEIELVEQPVDGMRELAQVTAATSIPIAADESVERGKDARRAAGAGCCDLATVKLAKVGGIGEANGIASPSADLPLELARRPARDRRRRPRGPGAAVRGGGGGPRARARDPAPVRGDDRRPRIDPRPRPAQPARRPRPRGRARRRRAGGTPRLGD